MAAANIVGAIPERHGAATSTTPTTSTGSVAKAGHVATTSRAAIPAGEPSSARITRAAWSPRATRTGHAAWSTTAAETEPSTAISTGPWPRLPTTMRSGPHSLASSTMAAEGRPRRSSASTVRPADCSGGPASWRTRVSSATASSSIWSASTGTAGIQGPPHSAGATSSAATIRIVVPGGQASEVTSARARSADGEPSRARRMRIGAPPGGQAEPPGGGLGTHHRAAGAP